MLKTTLFNIHKIGMYVAPFLWLYFSKIYWVYFIIILSWKLNNNKCLITQVEYYFFNETFLGKGKKFTVPVIHRNILYFNTILAILYTLICRIWGLNPGPRA